MTKLEIEAVDAFHAHLDKCEQCDNHPFDLCSEGAKLLKAVAEISPLATQPKGVPALRTGAA